MNSSGFFISSLTSRFASYVYIVSKEILRFSWLYGTGLGNIVIKSDPSEITLKIDPKGRLFKNNFRVSNATFIG